MKKIIDNVIKIQGGDLQNNSYVIVSNDSAIVIDPSFNVDKILSFLNENKINKISIFITHYHYDHVGDSELLMNNFKTINFYIGKKELNYLNGVYSGPFKKILKLFDANDKIGVNFLENDTNIIEFGIEIKAINTPSHTIGSYSYIYKNLFFTGDFIFFDCIGFFDTKHNGRKLFKDSYAKILKYVNDNTIICSGHNQIGVWKEMLKINNEVLEYGENNE